MAAAKGKSNYEKAQALGKEEIDKLLQEIKDSCKSPDEQIIENLEYAGFDPEVTRMQVLGTEGFDSKDVSNLLLTYIMRGTNINKMKTTVAEEFKQTFTSLLSKYDIQKNVEKGDRYVVTLARLAAAFPESVTFMCSVVKKRKPPVALTTLPHRFPLAMTTPVFASVIPANVPVVTSCLMDAHLLYQILLDDVINGGKSTWDDIVKYQKAAFQSKIMSQTERQDCCIKAKLLWVDNEGIYLPRPEIVWAAFCLHYENEVYSGPPDVNFEDWEPSFIKIGVEKEKVADLKRRIIQAKNNKLEKDSRKRPRSASRESPSKRTKAVPDEETSESGSGAEDKGSELMMEQEASDGETEKDKPVKDASMQTPGTSATIKKDVNKSAKRTHEDVESSRESSPDELDSKKTKITGTPVSAAEAEQGTSRGTSSHKIRKSLGEVEKWE